MALLFQLDGVLVEELHWNVYWSVYLYVLFVDLLFALTERVVVQLENIVDSCLHKEYTGSEM